MNTISTKWGPMAVSVLVIIIFGLGSSAGSKAKDSVIAASPPCSAQPVRTAMLRIITLSFAIIFGGAVLAADSTVTNLPAASALDGTELFLGVQSGTSKKITGSQVKTLANTSAVDPRTTTTEAISNSDQGKLVTFSNGSAVACTIAQAGGGGNFAAGWATSLKNLGAGTVTCTPTTSTVDGSATVTLTTGQGLDLYSDGTNYFTQGGKGSSGGTPGGSSGQVQYNNSGAFGGFTVSGDGTLNTGTGALAVAKTGGVAFAASATTDTTNASNISSGNLGILRTAPGIAHPGYASAVWYPTYHAQAAGNTPVAATAYCTMFLLGGNAVVSIQAMGIRTTVNGGNLQLALYNNAVTASAGSRPGTLVGATANIVATSLGSLSGALSGGPFSVNPGFYWGCVQSDSTAVRWQSSYVSGTDQNASLYQGSATLANVVGGAVVQGVSTTTGVTGFGTWPTFVGATFTENTSGTGAPPAIAIQIQ